MRRLLLIAGTASAAGSPGDADGDGILDEREHTVAALTYPLAKATSPGSTSRTPLGSSPAGLAKKYSAEGGGART